MNSKKQVHFTSCPLCGSNHLASDKLYTDRYVSGEKFTLVRCSDCGFLFTQDFPDQTVIHKYYESKDYISHSDTHKGIVNHVYHQVRRFMINRKAGILRKALKNNQLAIHSPRLLDIGTGTGYFSYSMKQKGWDVTATEANETARTFALNHFNFKILPIKALDEFRPHSFEVITLWHVLEHIQDLHQTVDKLHELLVDHGVLVLALPNHSSKDALHYKDAWAAYDAPRHLWHFNPDTLDKLANRHGFEVVKKYAMPFDTYYVSMLTEKELHHTMPFVRGMFHGLVSHIKSLFSGVNSSSSVIYVLNKKTTTNKEKQHEQR